MHVHIRIQVTYKTMTITLASDSSAIQLPSDGEAESQTEHIFSDMKRPYHSLTYLSCKGYLKDYLKLSETNQK